MLRNGETMVSVRFLPGQLSKLEFLCDAWTQELANSWRPKRLTRSAVILLLVERETLRLEEMARAKADEEAKQRTKPKRKKGKVKT
jgi:hypothetical protein